MTSLNYNNIVDVIISISLYFIFALLGAFIKDLYDSITKDNETIKIKRILIGSIFAAFLVFGFEKQLMEKWGLNFTVFLSFLSGVLGFELFGKWITMDLIEKWFNI